jgi:hypothetical protein
MTVGTKTGAGAAAAAGCNRGTADHRESRPGILPARIGAGKLQPAAAITTPVRDPQGGLRLANQFDPAHVDLGAAAGRISRVFEMHQVAA